MRNLPRMLAYIQEMLDLLAHNQTYVHIWIVNPVAKSQRKPSTAPTTTDTATCLRRNDNRISNLFNRSNGDAVQI